MPVRAAITMVLLPLMLLAIASCEEPRYDASTPDAALDSMRAMIDDGRPELLVRFMHIGARDRTFADGVTEASAIDDVRGKTGDLLAQLWRVSNKLKDRYPGQVLEEVDLARESVPVLMGGRFEEPLKRFLLDPFRWIDEQRDRLTTVDLGDGTAAVLWDGQPAFGGLGLQMIETAEGWMIDIPVDLPPINEYRPETREEWAVLANLMLTFENSLRHFEERLDDGDFHSLEDAANQAGRMLGESAIVQGMIYMWMKRGDRDA